LTDKAFGEVDLKRFDDLLQICDKDIFQQLCQHKITFDQFPQKVYERRFGIHYKTLEDFKLVLPAERFDVSEERREMLSMIYSEGEEMWSHMGAQCLKSLNFKPKKKRACTSHFFRAVPRTKSRQKNK
jgi:hypothetical protein